jgi:hypothetical protein
MFETRDTPPCLRSIQHAKIEAVGDTQESSQMRTEPQLRLGIQVVETSQGHEARAQPFPDFPQASDSNHSSA